MATTCVLGEVVTFDKAVLAGYSELCHRDETRVYIM